jgi:hypothetical protein
MRASIFAVISLFPAVLFGQIPEFIQQYEQRLGGAADELRLLVQHFDEDSRRSGYQRSDALQLMGRNTEQLVRDQSIRMSENIGRLANLQEQQVTLRQRGSAARFVSFAYNYDRPLATRTWENYQIGFPLSLAGALFALIGFALSFLVLCASAVVLGMRPTRLRQS